MKNGNATQRRLVECATGGSGYSFCKPNVKKNGRNIGYCLICAE